MTRRSWPARIARMLAIGLLSLAALSVLQVAAFRWLPVPITSFMIGDWIAAATRSTPACAPIMTGFPGPRSRSRRRSRSSPRRTRNSSGTRASTSRRSTRRWPTRSTAGGCAARARSASRSRRIFSCGRARAGSARDSRPGTRCGSNGCGRSSGSSRSISTAPNSAAASGASRLPAAISSASRPPGSIATKRRCSPRCCRTRSASAWTAPRPMSSSARPGSCGRCRCWAGSGCSRASRVRRQRIEARLDGTGRQAASASESRPRFGASQRRASGNGMPLRRA